MCAVLVYGHEVLVRRASNYLYRSDMLYLGAPNKLGRNRKDVGQKFINVLNSTVA